MKPNRDMALTHITLALLLTLLLAPCDAQQLRRSERGAAGAALLQPDFTSLAVPVGAQGTALSLQNQQRRPSQRTPGKSSFTGRAAHWAGLCLFALVNIGALGWVVFKLASLYVTYRATMTGFKTKGFKAYLMYSFEIWFERTETATAYVVLGFSFLTLLAGTAMYAMFTGTNMFTSMWQVFAWLVAPDGGVTESKSHVVFLGCVMSVFGLIVFALILMLLQDTFVAFLKMQTEGLSPVMESGHTMLVGFSDEAVLLIRELCRGHADTNGTTIVVLSETVPKPEVEQRIRDAEIDLFGSQIVVRCGQANNDVILRHVAGHKARTVILLPPKEDSHELRDAWTFQALLTMRSRGWPMNGRILSLCSLPRNYNLLVETGGAGSDVVMLDHFMSKLIVQCTKQAGLGRVFSSVLGFGEKDDAEFYIISTPDHLVGRTFCDAAEYFSSAVLCGTLDKESCTFCPGLNYQLAAGQELVLLANDAGRAVAADVSSAKPSHHLLAAVSSSSGCSETYDPQRVAGSESKPRFKRSQTTIGASPETVLIIGFNDLFGKVVLELDKRVPLGSTVLAVAPQDEKHRDKMLQWEIHRAGHELENITNVQFIEGHVGCRFVLEELPTPIEETSRIFLLADANAENEGKADSATLIAKLQIRELLTIRKTQKYIAVIPEIRQYATENQCIDAGITDFINTTNLPSQILGMIAYRAEIKVVLHELISDEGRVSVSIRCLSDYLSASSPTPTVLSFLELSRIVGESGDVAIGWSLPFDDTFHGKYSQDLREKRSSVYSDPKFFFDMYERAKAATHESRINEYQCNPADKTAEREWSMDVDMVVVLTPAGSIGSARFQDSG